MRPDHKLMTGIAQNLPWKRVIHHMPAHFVDRFGGIRVNHPEIDFGERPGEAAELGRITIRNLAIGTHEYEDTGPGREGEWVAGVAGQIQCGGHSHTCGQQKDC